MAVQPLIDRMRRCSLDCLHDLGKRKYPTPDFIGQRRDDEVYVIRHDNDHAEVVSLLVIVHTALENDLSRPVRQYAAPFRYKGDEVRLAITLQMRQVTTIERHVALLLITDALPSTNSDKQFVLFPV